MERSHRKLCTGFTDGLSRDDTYGFTYADLLARRKVGTVAVSANAVLALTFEDGANVYGFDTCFNDRSGLCEVEHIAVVSEDVAVLVDNVADNESAGESVCQRLDNLVAVLDVGYPDTFGRAAVLFSDDNVLRNVNKSSGKVTGVSRLKSGIGKGFTGTTRTHEVFQYGKTFTEAGLDRDFHRTTVGREHKTTHTCELSHLSHRTTGTGVTHHVDGVVAVHAVLQCFDNVVGRILPNLDNAVIAFVLGEQTSAEATGDLFNVLLCLSEDLLFEFGNRHIENRDGDCSESGVFITVFLDRVKNLSGNGRTVLFDRAVNDLTELLLLGREVNFKLQEVFGLGSVYESEVLRNRSVEDQAAERSVDDTGVNDTVDLLGDTNLDGSVQAEQAVGVSHHCFVEVTEVSTFTKLACAVDGEVVGTEYHVLRRNGNGFTVHGLQEVVCGKHKESCFRLSLVGKRYVNRHLVTVKVRVKCGTNERMELDRSTFNEDGLERLNGKTVECRRTVQEDRMVLDYVFKCVPNLGACLVNLLLCVSDVGSVLGFNKAFHNERLEELERHFLRKTALINLQRRSYDDNGTSGIVNTFTEQVLTETSLLTAEAFRERLQRTVGRARYGLSVSAVVDECVDCFLKHSLFVLDNDIGSIKLKELFESVISVDNAAIQVVQVGGCESAAVELYHCAEVRRNNGENVHYHPFRLVVGFAERFNYLKSLDDTELFLTACGSQFSLEVSGKLFEVEFLKKLFDRFRTHAYAEIVFVFFIHLMIFRFGEHLLFLKRSITAVKHDVLTEVNNLFEKSGRDIKEQTHSGGSSLEIPNVGNGSSELDVTHTFTADLLGRYLNAAFVADLIFVAYSFIFSARAFPVLGRSKDLFAEQAVAFRTERTVVDGLGLGNLAIRPASDHFGRCQANLD